MIAEYPEVFSRQIDFEFGAITAENRLARIGIGIVHVTAHIGDGKTAKQSHIDPALVIAIDQHGVRISERLQDGIIETPEDRPALHLNHAKHVAFYFGHNPAGILNGGILDQRAPPLDPTHPVAASVGNYLSFPDQTFAGFLEKNCPFVTKCLVLFEQLQHFGFVRHAVSGLVDQYLQLHYILQHLLGFGGIVRSHRPDTAEKVLNVVSGDAHGLKLA